MRRKRTVRDSWFYALLACIALMAAALVFDGIEHSRLLQENADLREQLNAQSTPEPATGGAEIPIPEFVASANWRFPVADSDFLVLTSPFGYRVSPLLNVEMYHTGLDIAAAWKAQVVAVADGTVVEHWPPPDGYWRGHNVYGGMVEIEHADGMRTLYAHLSWTRIHTGDHVRAGEVIGRIGNTGKSDGQHLHLEVIAPDGQRLNPLLYIEDPK